MVIMVEEAYPNKLIINGWWTINSLYAIEQFQRQLEIAKILWPEELKGYVLYRPDPELMK